MTESDFEDLRKVVLAEMDGLSPHLTYHSKEHTIDVIRQAVRIAKAEGIGAQELLLLKIAALFHDTGFLKTYVNHEVKGCEFFLSKINGRNFSAEEKSQVQGLIMATKIPQQPQDHLQQIICDADLDYLGRSDFFEIGELLKKEFLYYNIVASDADWEKMQRNFLKTHRYHTSTSRALREPVKQENYAQLA